MPGINGSDVLVLVDTGNTTPNFVVLAGQRNCGFQESNALIDISSKDSGRRGEYLAGRLEENVTLEALFINGDSAYSTLKNASKNGTSVTIQRRFQGVDVEYADAIVTTRGEDFPDQDAALVNLDFRITGDWTPAP